MSFSVRNVCSNTAPTLMLFDAFHVGNVGVNTRIRQEPELRDGFVLKRPQVGKRIVARVIVILVVPHVSADGEHGIRIQEADPRRRNVKGPDLRALIGRPQRGVPVSGLSDDGAWGVLRRHCTMWREPYRFEVAGPTCWEFGTRNV